MRGLTVLFVVLGFFAAAARADNMLVYSSPLLDVVIDDIEEIPSPQGPLGRFRLVIWGKSYFEPSSFDGVMRDGVINGATGITGDSLFTPGYESLFLDDPADVMNVDLFLLPGYLPDAGALTGLFAISNPSAVSSVWNLAEVTVAAGSTVTLDFTIGEVGGEQTEFVWAAFTAPGNPSMPGDVDGDGDVDLDDFIIIKAHFGSSGALPSDGDVDGDGDVDLDDFVIFKNNFGAGAAALPEPGTLALVAVGVVCLRRRCRQ